MRPLSLIRNAAILESMARFKHFGKIILFDSLAGLCFIGVILFGWLPAREVFHFFFRLGLLAVNHDWAERWLETAKHKGKTFKQILFPRVPWTRHTYDIASVGLLLDLCIIYFSRFNTLLSVASVAVSCFLSFCV